MRIDAIVVDCRDASPLARFWAEVLGWTVAHDDAVPVRLSAKGIATPDGPTVMVEPPDRSDLPVLFFVEVPEPKLVKNRVHLDIQAEEDLDEDVARLESLGARVRNWVENDGGTWCVMLDPEGNEFCVMPPSDGVA